MPFECQNEICFGSDFELLSCFRLAYD